LLEGFIAFDKLLSDVEITDEATNLVRKKKSSPCSRLKSIANVAAYTLKIDDLRMFCSRNQIRGGRKASKYHLCRAIADAKVKFDSGVPLPYDDLFPFGETEQPIYGTIKQGDQEKQPIDAMMMDDCDGRPDKKRSRDDYEEADMTRPSPMNLTITEQSQIAQSIQVRNMAIYLKETIDSASVVRRDIREERALRDDLWQKLIELVGDESVAFSEYSAFKKARQESENGVEDGGEDLVKGSTEQVLTDLYEEDSLIVQLKKQHVKLTDAISKLV